MANTVSDERWQLLPAPVRRGVGGLRHGNQLQSNAEMRTCVKSLLRVRLHLSVPGPSQTRNRKLPGWDLGPPARVRSQELRLEGFAAICIWFCVCRVLFFLSHSPFLWIDFGVYTGTCNPIP